MGNDHRRFAALFLAAIALVISGCGGGPRDDRETWRIQVKMKAYYGRSYATTMDINEPAWPAGIPLVASYQGNRCLVEVGASPNGGRLVHLRFLPASVPELPLAGPLPRNANPFLVTDRIWDLPPGMGIELDSARAELAIMPNQPQPR